MPDHSADVTALSAYAAKRKKELIMQLLNGLDFYQDITANFGVKDNLLMPKLTVNAGLRPYSATKEFKKGDLMYSDRKLVVDPAKRELNIDARDYRKTYMNDVLTPGTPANKNEIPYEKQTWQAVIDKNKQELNDKTCFFGFDKTSATAYSGATAYAVGDYITFAVDGVTEYFKCLADTTAGDSPITEPDMWQNVTAEAVTKGFGTLISELIADDDLVPVTIGNLATGAEAVAGFKEFYRSQTVPYRSRVSILHCSYTDWDLFIDGMQDRLKYVKEDAKSTEPDWLYLPESGKKCIVKPATWMGESRRLILEPGELNNGNWRGMNLQFGTDLLNDMNTINTVPDLWTLQIGILFLVGFQIADLEAIRVSDIE